MIVAGVFKVYGLNQENSASLHAQGREQYNDKEVHMGTNIPFNITVLRVNFMQGMGFNIFFCENCLLASNNNSAVTKFATDWQYYFVF